MQRGNEPKIIATPIVETDDSTSGGQVIGISFGADFCAEHESGIAYLLDAFGVPGKPKQGLVGADVRTITKVPENFKFFGNIDGYAYLFFTSSFRYLKPDDLNASTFNRMLHVYQDDEALSTAWDSGEFGVRLKNDESDLSGTIVLWQLFQALRNKDAMMLLAGAQLPGFSNHGLVLAIRSRVPDEAIEKMRSDDENYVNLVSAAEQTGIAQKLKDADKRYFALRPRWTSDVSHLPATKHPVVFFLNPWSQDKYNDGWFTVEHLLEWIDGTGPVVKTKAA